MGGGCVHSVTNFTCKVQAVIYHFNSINAFQDRNRKFIVMWKLFFESTPDQFLEGDACSKKDWKLNLLRKKVWRSTDLNSELSAPFRKIHYLMVRRWLWFLSPTSWALVFIFQSESLSFFYFTRYRRYILPLLKLSWHLVGWLNMANEAQNDLLL
jgi:hypothetical protein